MKTMLWPLRLYAETWTASGRRRRLAHWVEGAGDARGAIRAYVARLPRSWEWDGVAVLGITPLGQPVRVIIGEPS